jgi:hypothetical protein
VPNLAIAGNIVNPIVARPEVRNGVRLFASIEPHASFALTSRHHSAHTRADAVAVPPLASLSNLVRKGILPDKFWARKNEFLLGEISRCVGSRSLTADPTGLEGWSMVRIRFRCSSTRPRAKAK